MMRRCCLAMMPTSRAMPARMAPRLAPASTSTASTLPDSVSTWRAVTPTQYYKNPTGCAWKPASVASKAPKIDLSPSKEDWHIISRAIGTACVKSVSSSVQTDAWQKDLARTVGPCGKEKGHARLHADAVGRRLALEPGLLLLLQLLVPGRRLQAADQAAPVQLPAARTVALSGPHACAASQCLIASHRSGPTARALCPSRMEQHRAVRVERDRCLGKQARHNDKSLPAKRVTGKQPACPDTA